ncbi:hypothetical protein G5714_014812 [Onychostoma macrolepis]|uniref:Uncharacterized protein n=1 Tax=Onychostoma macrolepis TaxID=369639 RepID=A0A7J6CB39_9TELE|nr:hypothetical protein G5714_014812 [Onychostoma macrolepis]
MTGLKQFGRRRYDKVESLHKTLAKRFVKTTQRAEMEAANLECLKLEFSVSVEDVDRKKIVQYNAIPGTEEKIDPEAACSLCDDGILPWEAQGDDTESGLPSSVGTGLEKLHAIGYKPVLLLGKETKKKENKCEILTPRCTLSTYAQDYLQKIGSFYEYLCEGWNQDSSGNDDQLITLHLTPCDSLENTSSREESSQAHS